MKYFIPLAAFGAITGVWTIAFLFHLVPLAADGFLHWWEMPWSYTAVAVGIGVAFPFFKLGIYLADKYAE